MAIKRSLVVGAALAAIVGVAILLRGQDDAAPPDRPAPPVYKTASVEVVRATKDSVQMNVQTQGETRALDQIRLASEVSGRVAHVAAEFAPGAAFRKGDVLIRIADVDYRHRVVQARAAVASAENRFAMERAEAEVALRELDSLGFAGASDLARRRPQLAEAQAELASAQAALAEAELSLARTKIVAPFDGRVVSRDVSTGDYVAAGATLGEVFSIAATEIIIPLNDDDLARMGLPVGYVRAPDDAGREVVVSQVLAGELRTWRGRLQRISAQFRDDTRSLAAYAEVRDPFAAGADRGYPLAPGLFVDVAIAGRSIADAIIAPRAAILAGDAVFVISGENAVSRREVTYADHTIDTVIITNGVAAGERIVVAPDAGLRDGMTVSVSHNPEPPGRVAQQKSIDAQ